MADLIKNIYNEHFFDQLTKAFSSVYVDFNAGVCMQRIKQDDWEQLEFKQRLRRISESLLSVLPEDYLELLSILEPVSEQIRGLEAMIFPDMIEIRGICEESFINESLDMLEHITPFSSSEFAVRPFIIKYPEQTMNRMVIWSEHPNEHVRRLASEGCRPRLPWAMALPEFKKDPRPVIRILERLKQDPSEYVRRSVGNNLNDISKDHPEQVLGIASAWYGYHPQTDWIVRHGCRTLLKKCHPEALVFFGFDKADEVDVELLQVHPSEVSIGDEVSLSFQVNNGGTKPRRLRIEYAIDFVKANHQTSRKSFKAAERDFKPGITTLKTRHSFREMTTRKHYPGNHSISIIVNGSVKACVSCLLNKAGSELGTQ
jgi:3-methyladenine DNA glycosylase AlkC